MPPITPSHYWSFFVISNGVISGKASLKVNGKCQTVDGGLLLDGTSGYLSSHLTQGDALTNPGDFLDGFTLGLKLKFPKEGLAYDNPRYVIDTGEKSVNSPGVSLYLLSKKLVFELATFDTRWKVIKNLSTEFFFSFSFLRKPQGNLYWFRRLFPPPEVIPILEISPYIHSQQALLPIDTLFTGSRYDTRKEDIDVIPILKR